MAFTDQVRSFPTEPGSAPRVRISVTLWSGHRRRRRCTAPADEHPATLRRPPACPACSQTRVAVADGCTPLHETRPAPDAAEQSASPPRDNTAMTTAGTARRNVKKKKCIGESEKAVSCFQPFTLGSPASREVLMDTLCGSRGVERPSMKRFQGHPVRKCPCSFGLVDVRGRDS